MINSITPKDVKRCKDSKALASYAMSFGQEIKLAVAKNPNTSASTLNELARESNINIALEVAKNRSTGKRGLYYLGVNLMNEEVALAVANNGKTSRDILDRMFDIWKEVPEIVKAIKTHPNVSDITAELCTFCEMY